ncbi:MAG: PAS domain S-box protein [Puniceicoccaceae bacterium]
MNCGIILLISSFFAQTESVVTASEETRPAFKAQDLNENSPPIKRRNTTSEAVSFSLSLSERDWLKEHATVRIGLPGDTPPLAVSDATGKMHGIYVDYLRLITERTGLGFEVIPMNRLEPSDSIQPKPFDLLLSSGHIEGEDFNRQSRTLIQLRYVTITRQDAPFLADRSWLEGKKVSIVRDSPEHRQIMQAIPQAEIVPCDDIKEALDLLSSSQVDACVGELITSGYTISHEWITNLKIAGPTGIPYDSVRFSVRGDWPQLVAILNKTINSFDASEHDAITGKWIAVHYDQQTDMLYFWKWIGISFALFFLVVAGVFIWNRKLRQAVDLQTAEMVKANKELNEIKTQFEAVYHHHYQLTGLMDADGRLLLGNKTALDFAGVSKEDLAGKLFWTTPFFKHSRQVQEKVKDAVKRSAKGEFVRFETTHISAQGKLRDFDFCITPVFGESGEVIYLVPEGYDITDRKKKEEQVGLLSEVLDAAPSSVMIHDVHGTMLFANQASRIVHGFKNMEEFMKVTIYDMNISESHKQIDEILDRISADGESRFEVVHKRKDGSSLPLEIQSKVIDWHGRPAFLSIGTDITQRKQTEQAMHRQLNELRRWYDVTLGREERLTELKEEVNQLSEEMGKPKRYFT